MIRNDVFTGTVLASMSLSTQLRLVIVIICKFKLAYSWENDNFNQNHIIMHLLTTLIAPTKHLITIEVT